MDDDEDDKKEAIKAYFSNYRMNHRDKIRQHAKAFKERNPEYFKNKQREFRERTKNKKIEKAHGVLFGR